jgi:hypothetical protein
MVMLAFAAAFLGIALGLHYKILVLIFAMLFIGAGAAISTLAPQGSFLNLILELTLTFTCLQLGFICGAVGRRWRSLIGPSGGWPTTSPFNWPTH